MPTQDRFIRPNIEPRYPTMTENSFKKDAKKYAALSSAVILAYLKKELKEISKDRPITAAEMTALLTSVSKLNNKLETENESSLSLVHLRNKLERYAKNVWKFSSKDFRNLVKRTLNKNIRTDIYDYFVYEQNIPEWVENNVSLMQNLSSKQTKAISDAVYKAFLNKDDKFVLSGKIKAILDTSDKYAVMLAADQLFKLNSQINRQLQTSVGCTHYIWRTMEDDKVRIEHRKLNGRVCEWVNPPIVDRETGRTAHPGEDYNCRCIAIPIFDRQHMYFAEQD